MQAANRNLLRWSHVALVLATALAAGTAAAQWQWIDGTGSRVFSDTPPPAGTPDKNILKRPGAARTTPAEADTAAPAPAAAQATAPKPAAQDKDLQARKKQAEEAELAQKKAEQALLVKARAENCERATRAKATLDSGVRIATTNAKGEREVMDDSSRASEAKRLDDIIRSDCGPLPAVQ
jgi:type IV secretory pathway VirB10-like protein